MHRLRLHYDAWHKNKLSLKGRKYEERTNRKILSILGIRKGESLLDLGCGKGSFCNSAAKEGLNVYGVDFSEVALKEAKSLNNEISFTLADAGTLPFRDNCFDYTVCLGSLEHFSDKVSTLKELNRVIKRDGKIFIFLPNSYFLGHIYLVWKTGLPPDEGGQEFSEGFNTYLGWKKFLEGNSLKVIATYNFNTIWASGKVSRFNKYIYNFILKPFVPFNLSYAFGYLCVKNEERGR